MIYLDLFSGIGGFARGLHEAGFRFEKHYFSEIDKYATANYKHNFKDAEYVGAVEHVSGIKRPNIVTFGFPCQDLSIAGKRKGLDGERSGLFFEAIKIIEKYKPEVFVFENVKGLLSSNGGKDFETVLRTIANLGVYECEWQLLNSSWFLPQNRERVYFIGHLRGKSRPRVFPIREDDKLSSGSLRQTSGEKKRIQIQPDRNASSLTSRLHKMGVDDNYISLRWVRSEKGKEARRQSQKQGKDDTPFGDGHREFQPSEDNTIGCLTSEMNKDSLIYVKSNTKKGYDIAEEGDTINLQNPTSRTRRGRIGKRKSQTLDTQNHQAVVEKTGIRRLTEIECERLQGFPDNWTQFGDFGGEIKKISRTQRYKQLGNAVSVPVVKEIVKRLLT